VAQRAWNVIVGAELHRLNCCFYRSVAVITATSMRGGALDLLRNSIPDMRGMNHVGEHHVHGLFLEKGESSVTLSLPGRRSRAIRRRCAEAADVCSSSTINNRCEVLSH